MLPVARTLYKSERHSCLLHFQVHPCRVSHPQDWEKLPANTVENTHPLTFDHVSFVVTVIVAVGGPVIDVEALDRSVVVTRGAVLYGDGNKD